MLINRKAVKQFVLKQVALRPHKFTRVSAEYIEALEAHLRNKIAEDIKRLPSIGRTVYPEIRKASSMETKA